MSYQDKLKPVPVATTTKSYSSKLKPVSNAPTPELPAQAKDGFLKSIVKDAAKTLLVKPADRFAEAVGRTGILGSTIKEGYEAQADEGVGRTFAGITVEPQRSWGEGGGKQLVGDALKTASYLYSGGTAAPVASNIVKSTVPGASKTLFKQTVREGAKQSAKVGAVGGGAYASGEELGKEDSTIGSALQAGVVGAGVGALTGGAIGTAIPYATKLVNPAERAIKQANEVENALRRVVPQTQKSNPTRDSAITSKVLRELDIDGSETNIDFAKKADERIKAIMDSKEKIISTNPVTRKLNEFTKKVGADDVNHVSDALNQLEKQYRKTNSLDTPSAVRVRQLKEKAQTTGLTPKELDEIAVISGQDLKAFNVLTGMLDSGVTKQAVENTRKGVKQASRDLFDQQNSLLKEADEAVSDLIRFKTIRENRAKAVEAFKSKIVDPTLREKLQGLISQVVDIATLGSAKGLISLAMKGSATTKKTLNALDMEQMLAKDLQLIKEASKKGASEADIISKLQQFIKNNGEKPVLLLEAPKPKPLFATAKGKISPIAQEASDIASVESGKAKTPKSGPIYQKRLREIRNKLEAYLTPDEMEVIQMGTLPRPKRSNLPVADTPPNVYTNPKTLNEYLQTKLERYLTPDEMEVIQMGNKPKPKKSLSDIYID